MTEPPPPTGPEPASPAAVAPKRSPRAAWAVVLGVFVGLVLAVPISIFNLTTGMSLMGAQQSCVPAAFSAALEIGLSAGVAYFAWWAVRRKDASFSGWVVRGMAVAIAVFFLAPWPCSFTGGAYLVLTLCHR